MTKSEIFTQYNKARAAAKSGKLDAGRVNRALGIVQRKAQQSDYLTTTRGCSCEDRHQHPGQACKHMVAKMIEVKIERIHAAKKPAIVAKPKVIYCEFEYASASPWNIVDEPWDASHCKYSIGSGLVEISAEALAEKLNGYYAIKTDYVKKNTWGTHSFKMWWEQK